MTKKKDVYSSVRGSKGSGFGNRYVRVYAHRDENEVEVSWFCGTSRTFDPDELEQIIELADKFCTAYPELWLTVSFPGYAPLYVRLEDDNLMAVEGIPRQGRTRGLVPWALLRRVLKQALADLEKNDERADDEYPAAKYDAETV